MISTFLSFSYCDNVTAISFRKEPICLISNTPVADAAVILLTEQTQYTAVWLSQMPLWPWDTCHASPGASLMISVMPCIPEPSFQNCTSHFAGKEENVDEPNQLQQYELPDQKHAAMQ